MRLTVPEPEIPHVGGFTEKNDLFGYKGFADRLANVVGNIDEPLVIVLDGPWGSGKSVFIKQWAGLLRKRGAPVIYFDAFQHDYYEDAFLALSAEIYATAKKVLGGNEGAARRFLTKAKKAGTVLAPVTARVAARVGTAGLLNLEDVAAGGEAAKAAVKALGDESAKAVERAIEERLRKAVDELAAMEAFRQALSDLAAKLAERKEKDEAYPLVFIVDELDRCRPPFALGIVERIKHLFSVPGVCFVLVTNLSELEKSVQGAYGPNFGAQEYLEKFYHLRLTLLEYGSEADTKTDAYITYLWRALGIEFAKPEYSEAVREQIKDMIAVFDLPLRRVERVMMHISLISAAAPRNRPVFPAIVAGLCVMRHIHPELYDKARKQGLTWDEALTFLQPSKGVVVQDEWFLNWWKFAVGEEMSEDELDRFNRSLWNYSIRDRTSLIPLMANYIDELIQRPPDEDR